LPATFPAIAVKFALVAPAPTITEAGTVSDGLFDERATDPPPARAAEVSITVQVVVAVDITGLGEHEMLETAGSGVTVTEAAALPFRVAVTETV